MCSTGDVSWFRYMKEIVEVVTQSKGRKADTEPDAAVSYFFFSGADYHGENGVPFGFIETTVAHFITS